MVGSDEAVRASYERIPYPSRPHHLSHPNRLATVAVLHGLEPPRLETCRVLELGCSDGGNLIPMAAELPGGRFVGIDLSPRQIAGGRSLIDSCGLRNVELHEMSLRQVEPGFGEFDYIIAHGVFSWVDDDARDKILGICQSNLAAQGIAFVSYNTLPGWHFRRVLRDLMRYHTRDVEDPLRKTASAAGLVRRFAEAVVEKEDAYGRFLRWCKDHLDGFEDRSSYLVHEYLETDNEPLYFHQFVDLAAAHGLSYLGEAETSTMAVENLPEAVAEDLRRFGGDRVGVEQYMDFLRNRSFRQSLLCHAGQEIDRTFATDRLSPLHATAAVRPEPPEDGGDGQQTTRFRLPDGKAFSTTHPMAREALLALGEAWPAALSFDRLLQAVRRRLPPAAAADPALAGDRGAETLAEILWTSFFGGVLDLHVWAPPIASTVDERPAASEVARCQAARGGLVTNLWHRPIRLDDEVARLLLGRLDGRRDRAALASLLHREVRAGRLELSLDHQPVAAPSSQAVMIDSLLDSQLRKMLEWALLRG